MKKSILIITYKRDDELYDTLENISKYKKNDLELLILDNNKNNFRKKKIEKIFQETVIELKYYHDGENYGVALGRNYIIEKAKGDILITLDDDIEIKDINELLDRVEKYFYADENIGCLAFNIKNYYTKKALRHEIPHGNKKLDFTKNIETYYFIGAGHAIRTNVYKECGIYPNDLGKYGGEEEDLSYRILEKYKILYCADLEIYHKISSKGRLMVKDENYYRYRNKLIVRKRYLQKKYFITNLIIWSLYYLFKKKGELKKVFFTLKKLKEIEEIEKIKKIKINKKLKKLNARKFY